MRPHPRIRKTIKWTSAAATALLLAAWIGSGWISAGRMTLDQIDIVSDGCFRHEYLRIGFGSGGWSGWGMSSAPRWRFGFEFLPYSRGYTRICIPLWAPLLVAAASTIVAWRLDTLATRRALRNHCSKCRYDRTGLPPTTPCPECGSKPQPA